MANRVWNEVTEGRRDGAVSAVALFELNRLGLRGAVPSSFVASAQELIPLVCEVVWINNMERLQRAARLSHGNGLSMADALILAASLELGCAELYTTDPDLESYEGREIDVIRLA